jgi:hypothetical protein
MGVVQAPVGNEITGPHGALPSNPPRYSLRTSSGKPIDSQIREKNVDKVYTAVYAIKIQLNQAIRQWNHARFFCCLMREEPPRPRVLQQRTGKKQGLTIKLCQAQSSAPLPTRSNPYGLHKYTRNARPGQFRCPIAARRPWTISVAGRWAAGAFFIRPQGGW